MKKKQILKKCNNHIKKLINKPFYKAVKDFINTDLYGKSVKEIENIFRNIISNDLHYKYRNLVNFSMEDIGEGASGLYDANIKKIFISDDLLNYGCFKDALLSVYFHEAQHSNQSNVVFYNNKKFYNTKNEYEKLLLAEYLCWDKIYYSSIIEIDARITQIERMMDLKHRNLMESEYMVCYDVINIISKILFGLNFVNVLSNDDVTANYYTDTYNHKNLTFKSEKLIEYHKNLIEEEIDFNKAREILDRKLESIKKHAEECITFILKNSYYSKSIIKTSGHSAYEWKTDSENFTLADKVQFIARYDANQIESVLQHTDTIYKEIVRRSMQNKKERQKIHIKEPELEKE